LSLNLPDNKEGILTKLCDEKIIIKNHSKYDISNLGAILFARNLTKFPLLRRKSVRIIIYKGKNKLETIKEFSSDKGYAIDFENIVNYIIEQLPANEVIQEAFRKKVEMYPAIAIRELVANTIIHQDFSEKGTSPMIEIYEDRIEFTNPGNVKD